jgi:transposase-like protein
MIYTVYKTVNLVNGKFYLGVHKTDNPNDEYLGSGTYIIRAVAKYGPASFKKEILFEFETQEEAWKKEDEVVELHRKDPLCMNLRKGGSGGFDYVNTHFRFDRVSWGRLGSQKVQERRRRDPEFAREFMEKWNRIRVLPKRVTPKLLAACRRLAESRRGKHHTLECRKEMSRLAMGENNHSFGNMWMYKNSEVISVPESEAKERIRLGWLPGRGAISEFVRVCPKCEKEFVTRDKTVVHCSSACGLMKKIPPVEELRTHLEHTGYRQIGNIYGVSAMTVHEWAKKFGLSRKKLSMQELRDKKFMKV